MPFSWWKRIDNMSFVLNCKRESRSVRHYFDGGTMGKMVQEKQGKELCLVSRR